MSALRLEPLAAPSVAAVWRRSWKWNPLPKFAISDALARSEREPLATKIRRADIYDPEPPRLRPRRAAPEVEADLGMDIGM